MKTNNSKLIIIEGGDGLGKSSLISSICDFYHYDNISVRHFSKPPLTSSEGFKSSNAIKFNYQKQKFFEEAKLLNRICKTSSYFPERIIWNRSHLGEFVYGQIYREIHPHLLYQFIHSYEEKFLLGRDVSLILLDTSNIELFMSQEDGKSLGQIKSLKEQELELFRKIYEHTYIKNKIKVNVNDLNLFRKKQDIFNDIKHLL
jgi:thymidylate kinase